MKIKSLGFTLIELLIVIVVLGVLATVVMIAINPLGMINSANLAKTKTFAASVENLLSISQVGKWSFEEGQGNSPKDTSGYGNTGALSSVAPTWQDASTCGLGFGACLKLNGTSNYVSIGDKDILSFTNNVFTFSFWMKADDKTSLVGVLGKRGDPWEYSIYTEIGGTILCATWASDGSSVYSAVSASYDTNWNHFVCAADGANIRLYKNGVLAAKTVKTNASMGNTSAPFEIGRGGSSNARYMKGLLDEVQIYSQALTLSQIQQLYTQGLSKHQLANK